VQYTMADINNGWLGYVYIKFIIAININGILINTKWLLIYVINIESILGWSFLNELVVQLVFILYIVNTDVHTLW